MPDPNELEIELARKNWEEREAAAAASWAHTVQFGLASLRASGVINGAGAAALLAFVSANGAKMTGLSTVIIFCMISFIAGMLLSALATGCSYVSQAFFTLSARRYTPTWVRPFATVPNPDWRDRIGLVFQSISIALVIATYGTFLYGCYRFLDLVRAVVAT